MRKLFIWSIFTIFLFANNCGNKLFNLSLLKDVKFKNILFSLSNECNLNVIIKDEETKQILKSDISLLNVKNATLREFLDILFSSTNLFYKLRGDRLIISYYNTKIFKIDYISSSSEGSSELDASDGKVKSSFTFNFWDNLNSNISQILKNTSSFYKAPIIDKDSGLLTVTGTKSQLRAVQNYIDNLNRRLHREVVIDVKIYSVTLSKNNSTGINWGDLSATVKGVTPLRLGNLVGSSSIFSSSQFQVDGFLHFLAHYGNVSSISNPKIVTLNNQKALISVGDTVYYKYYETQNTQNGIIKVPRFDSLFVGILLDVVPQISDKGIIILRINPRISSFQDMTQLNDINRGMPPNTIDNKLMSVVRMKDNQTLVLGGLITNSKNLTVDGVPVLQEIPIIKYLFAGKNRVGSKKELVFVITPHIIDLNKKTTLKSYGYKRIPNLEELNVE